MPHPIRIQTPISKAVCSRLKAGDRVLISGKLIAARDAAHKNIIETLKRGESLPVRLQGEIIYYVGPSPAMPGHAVGSAGPTTSGRVDVYTPTILEHGLLGMIGKGDRSDAVVEAIKKHGAVYFAATGGAGALLARQIKSYTVLAYPELGAEALAEFVVEDFPVIVAIDCEGSNIYRTGPLLYRNDEFLDLFNMVY